jgi:hypothetical protein
MNEPEDLINVLDTDTRKANPITIAASKIALKFYKTVPSNSYSKSIMLEDFISNVKRLEEFILQGDERVASYLANKKTREINEVSKPPVEVNKPLVEYDTILDPDAD